MRTSRADTPKQEAVEALSALLDELSIAQAWRMFGKLTLPELLALQTAIEHKIAAASQDRK